MFGTTALHTDIYVLVLVKPTFLYGSVVFMSPLPNKSARTSGRGGSYRFPPIAMDKTMVQRNVRSIYFWPGGMRGAFDTA